MQDKSTLLHQTHPLPSPPSFTALQQTPIGSLKLPFTQWYLIPHLGLDASQWIKGSWLWRSMFLRLPRPWSASFVGKNTISNNILPNRDRRMVPKQGSFQGNTKKLLSYYLEFLRLACFRFGWSLIPGPYLLWFRLPGVPLKAVWCASGKWRLAAEYYAWLTDEKP